jgi:hypothetical protein
VVALRAGSVPEVVADGLTGYICDRPGELPAAIQRVGALDPEACRRHVLERFDVPDMVLGYDTVYRRAIAATAGTAAPAASRS